MASTPATTSSTASGFVPHALGPADGIPLLSGPGILARRFLALAGISPVQAPADALHSVFVGPWAESRISETQHREEADEVVATVEEEVRRAKAEALEAFGLPEGAPSMPLQVRGVYHAWAQGEVVEPELIAGFAALSLLGLENRRRTDLRLLARASVLLGWRVQGLDCPGLKRAIKGKGKGPM